jgi:hypothetical protein
VGTNKGFLRELFSLGCISDQIPDVPGYSTAILLKFVRSRRGRSHVRSILLESRATRSKSPLDLPGYDHVLRFVDHAHPAAAQLFGYPVMQDGLADHGESFAGNSNDSNLDLAPL